MFQPRKRGFQPDDLLLEVQLGLPILQVELGKFIPYVFSIFLNKSRSSNSIGIAVLHPRKIVVYSVVTILASGNEGSYCNLEKKYEHYLRHTAYNFTFGPFGGIGGTITHSLKHREGFSLCSSNRRNIIIL